ncbi:MAG TPA: hypothetical protein VGZ47_20780 [Gemmataceae bacterium]|nr:hypothetical protein [Gemmataceae bacterium]
MIQVVDSGPLSVRAALLDKGGLDMTFFATLASKKRNLVPVGIVEGLIRVLRLVTRVHWPLFMKMVEEPFEMWRKEHEATVTDEDEQEHYDSLVAAYRSTVEQEKMAIQKRWGFEELQTGVLQRPPETTE